MIHYIISRSLSFVKDKQKLSVTLYPRMSDFEGNGIHSIQLHPVSGNRSLYSRQSLTLVEYALLTNNNVDSTNILPAKRPAILLHCFVRVQCSQYALRISMGKL